MIIFIISLFFIILVIFWRMQKFICFSLTRAILYSCNLLCYNEGSGHVLMWGMISKNNYESAILCKCIWELWRHARRSYFRRFHWISESFLFHSGGVSSPLDGTMWHSPQCCCRAVDLYCPWMDFINDRRTSPDGCKPRPYVERMALTWNLTACRSRWQWRFE